MRRLIVTTFLSLFLISGTGMAFADNHRGGNHDKGRKEQKFDKKRPDGNKDRGRSKDRGRNKDKGHNKGHDNKGHGFRPGNSGHFNHQPQMPPAPPVHNGYRPKHYNHAYHYPTYSIHDNLGFMISQIARGGRDVNVWQVDPYTYVVRFRKGNHMYAQYLYPYEGRYGERSTISVNWAPLSPWTLIPGIHLNINL